MPDYSDDDIERLLIEGSDDPELKAFLGDAFPALRAEAADIEDQGDVSNELLGFGTNDKPLVYILPGIMGSKLSAQTGSETDLIWFDPLDVRNGGIAKLKFGSEPNPIVATGTFWAAYGLLRIRLRSRGYRAQFLPFDWRNATVDLGKALFNQIDKTHPNGVVLVAHSMGGLVARQMAAEDTTGVIKRVVTMGTPNFGSYSPVQVFRVSSAMLNQIGWLDSQHTPSEIAKQFLRHFPGLVEMMPAPEKRDTEPYFDPDYWPSGGARPNASTLSQALAVKNALPVPDERFHQIIGFGQDTAVSAKRANGEFEYVMSNAGDGTVPIDLAQVDGLPQYFVEDTHGGMVQRGDVARAVRDLIEDQATEELSKSLPDIGLTNETLSQPLGDTEIRKINRQAPRPDAPEAHQVLSEFLGHPPLGAAPDVDQSDSPIAPPEGAIIAPAEQGMSHKIDGYPLSVLMQASETWREPVSDDGLEAIIVTDRETDRRSKMYAERKLSQLRAVVEEAPKQRILPDNLQQIVATFEAAPEEAIARLLNERVMGEAEEFLSVLFLKRAPIVSKSVGRIIRRTSEIGFGTGFMVAPNVMITNHHVLPDPAEAEKSAIQFDYEINYRHREMQAESFVLRPDTLFYANKELDFALVAVALSGRETARALSDYGYLPLDGGEGKIKIGKPVNVIQHPNGERKQVVFREAELQDLPANKLGPDAQFSGAPADIAAHYTADTKPGSSGSPVFSDAWEVIALHHSGVAVRKNGKFRMKDQSFKHPLEITRDDDVDWVANEGIRISRITRFLEENPAQQKEPAQELIDGVLRVGRRAGKHGHFARPLPIPVLSQLDPVASGPDNETLLRRSQADTIDPGVTPTTAMTSQANGGAVEVTIPLKISVSLGDASDQSTLHVSTGPTDDSALLERRYTVEELADRAGYDADFLCKEVPLPILLNTAPNAAAEKLDGSGTVLDYDHYSVVMNAERRIAYYSAGNFDPSAPFKPTRDKEPWSFDPRISKEEQAGNSFYKHNPLDRGHLLRRTDGSWGQTRQAALRADHDTYFWTNIAPQHRVFNQSRLEPERNLWGNLENHVTAEANASNARVSILNGPVFGANDPLHRGWAVPLAFWKIVAFCDDGKLRALAFRLGQDDLLVDLPAERIAAAEFGVFQIKVRELERLTHLDFGVLRNADVLEAPMMNESFLPNRSEIRIRRVSDIVS